MKTKTIPALALAAAVSLAASACGAAPSETSLGSLDDKTVVARLLDETKVENPEEFRITLSDFNKEYKFRLFYSGLDETNEETAEACEEYRSLIIDYLTLEKISLYKAKEAGITAAAFSDEELASITASAENTIASYKASYEEEAKAALGEGYTDEQLEAKKTELLDGYLAECGYTTDIFYEWDKIDLIQTRLVEKYVADITVTDEEANDFFLAKQNEAKANYESDPAAFEANASYTTIYVPDGSRSIRHILLGFNAETASEISAKRTAGDNTEADALRDKAYESVREKAEAVLALLGDGGDFDALRAEYNEDPNGAYDCVVIPNTTVRDKGYSDAAFALEKTGDCSEIIVTDSGAYILSYASDAALSEEALSGLLEYTKSTLLSQKQYETANSLIDQWIKDFPFDVDYATLDITIEDDSEAEILDSAATAE